MKYSFQNPRPLPETYPLFEVEDVDSAFSTARGYVANGGHYLNYYEGQCKNVPQEWQSFAQKIFFGSANAEKIKVKEGLDERKVSRALHYLLTSWEPKHEEKIATVGFALMNWCEWADTELK